MKGLSVLRFRLKAITLLMVALPASAITTPQIIASALSTDCLQYRVVGVCYWLLCTPFGCTVKTSVKVKHNLPELVVSTYNTPGDNPWRDMAFTGSPVPGAEGGGDTNSRINHSRTKIRFKNADAFGHPADRGFYRFLSSFGYSCSGSSVPLQPYFLSTLDSLAWRSGIPESLYPEALTPGMREVGRPGDLWGNVYPRAGALGQTNDVKAGAVIAQRAADIVTRSGQPHVYLPLVESARPGYWPPPPVTEGQPGNHTWQSLSPRMSTTCAIFPDQPAITNWTDSQSTDGGYVRALWRPYACCQRRGQTFLGSTG